MTRTHALEDEKLWWTAIRNGDKESVERLLCNNRVDPSLRNKFEETPLFMAAKFGSLEIVELLLNVPELDLDPKNSKNGDTPFSIATKCGYKKIVELLLRTGSINADHRDHRGYPPVISAYRNGHMDIVKLLVASESVEVNCEDDDGNTLLHVASERGDDTVVRLLAEQERVDLNQEDESGWTALSNAALSNRHTTVDILIQTGRVYRSPRLPAMKHPKPVTASDPETIPSSSGGNCGICNSFQRPSPPHRLERSNLPWNHLISSSVTCRCCRVLRDGCQGLLAKLGLNTLPVVTFAIQFYFKTWGRNYRYTQTQCAKWITLTFASGRQMKIEVFTLADEECPCPMLWCDMPVSSRTSQNMGSKQALAALQQWLNNCSEDDCCGSPMTKLLPTRVLDVGAAEGVIALRENLGEEALYIALSHCWGTRPMLTTRKSNLESHKISIPEAHLSKTFRDAVALCRQIHVRYIWIDSLCIVQDDGEDWRTESAKMASVYGNAYLTIAATGSWDGSGGLFNECPDFQLKGTTPQGEDYQVYFREYIDHVRIGASSNDRFPLLSRGWCFQEHLLSPRIIHFGPYELLYECRETSDCECQGIYSEDMPEPKLSFSSMAEGDSTLYAIQRFWRSLVSHYSGLTLSKQEDCFPALSGIAGMLAGRRTGRYLAGMWEDSLQDDLLWSGSNTPRPAVWRAPSWSWASTTGGIYYHDAPLDWISDEHFDDRNDDNFRHYYRVLSCECRVKSSALFGALTSATLELKGYCIEATLEYEPSVETIQNPFTNHERREWKPEWYKLRLRGTPALGVFPDYALHSPGIYHVPSGSQVLCFCASWTAPPLPYMHDGELWSFILRPVGAETRNFERIGIFSLRVGRDDLCIYDNAKTRTVVIV